MQTSALQSGVRSRRRGTYGPLALALALSLGSASALAANVQLRDTADVISATEESQLRSAQARHPFDVRVVTTGEFADRASFDRYVAAQVGGANMVVVGLDPTHRRTSVHVGTGTRIATSELAAVRAAGNDAFRRGDWAGGIDAILTRAASAVGTASSTSSPATASEVRYGNGTTTAVPADRVVQPRRARPSMLGGLMLVGLFAVGGILLARFFARRRAASRQGYDGGYGQQGAPGYGPPPPYGPQGPAYGGPAYGPGYGPQNYGPGYNRGGMGSGLGGGLVGAGLGGLLGYGLGRAAGEHEHDADRHREAGFVPSEGAGNGGNENAGYDAGGSTGDWGGGDGGGDWGGGGGGDDGGGSDW